MQESFKKPKTKIEEGKVAVIIAGPVDWQIVKAIMLEAMTEEPEAIGSSFLEESAHPDEKWKKDVKDPRNFFVIVKDGIKPVGIAAVKQRSAGVWELFSVYLNHRFRGKGISKKIMENVLAEVRKRNGEKIRLTVGIRQEAAIELYRKFGFKAVDGNWVRNKKDKSVLNQYVMELNLDADPDYDYE